MRKLKEAGNVKDGATDWITQLFMPKLVFRHNKYGDIKISIMI